MPHLSGGDPAHMAREASVPGILELDIQGVYEQHQCERSKLVGKAMREVSVG